MLRAQASARHEIKTISMPEAFLINSGHNSDLESDIRENQILTLYRAHIPGSFPKNFKVKNSISEQKIRWPRDHYKL